MLVCIGTLFLKIIHWGKYSGFFENKFWSARRRAREAVLQKPEQGALETPPLNLVQEGVYPTIPLDWMERRVLSSNTRYRQKQFAISLDWKSKVPSNWVRSVLEVLRYSAMPKYDAFKRLQEAGLIDGNFLELVPLSYGD